MQVGASCVSKIEAALKQVSGVTNAEMNFAERSVLVMGSSSSHALIKAVEQAGYNATLANTDSDEAAIEEKEQADWAYYKKLMRDMVIALSLGCATDALWLGDGGNERQHDH